MHPAPINTFLVSILPQLYYLKDGINTMRYKTEIEVDLPREALLELLSNPEQMVHWQQGLLSFQPLSGEPGQEGAQMELQYQMGKRRLVMVETVLKRNFPEEYHLTYDAKGVHNIQKNYFEALGTGRSRWISESEFQFSSFPMKLMGMFMPGAFRKQSRAAMQAFKEFAETGASISNS